MKHRFTAVIQKEEDMLVALCPELDIASQRYSIEEAKKNLEEALALFFEHASPEEIKGRLKEDVYISPIEVAVA